MNPPQLPSLATLFLAGTLFCTDLSARVQESEKQPFRTEVLTGDLRNPWGLVELPDGTILITERGGALRVFRNGKLESEPVRGIPAVFARGQGGLLDIELHPDYEKNGWIYLAYSEPGDGGSHTAISRGRFKDGAFVDVEKIYTAPADQFTKAGHHFGCRLVFDGEGHLFFSIGDRGVMNNAQDLGLAAGKIHRIRDDGSIPADNPFVSTPGALPTIWAYGTRNAQGLRLDPVAGILWETEHGPRGGDELNIIKKGANYGWPVVSYGINYNGTTITDRTSAPGMEDPVIHWTPSIAVCGLEVCSGKLFPAWKGNLFTSALAGQQLVRIELDGQKVAHQEVLLERSGRIRHVKEGRDGTIYLLYDDPGRLVALKPAG